MLTDNPILNKIGYGMIIVWIIILIAIVLNPKGCDGAEVTRVEDTRGNLIYIIECDDYGYCTVYDVTDNYTPKYKIKKDKVYDMKGNRQGQID
jgi:hypothetical protein